MSKNLLVKIDTNFSCRAAITRILKGASQMRLLWVVALSLVITTGLFAQQTQVSGNVTDPSGAVIPNADITIVNVETGAQRETKADNQGRYVMPQLTPGTYKLTAKAA